VAWQLVLTHILQLAEHVSNLKFAQVKLTQEDIAFAHATSMSLSVEHRVNTQCKKWAVQPDRRADAVCTELVEKAGESE